MQHTTSWRYMMDKVENLPTSLHVGELYESLLQLDQQLQHVGTEQKHLQHVRLPCQDSVILTE